MFPLSDRFTDALNLAVHWHRGQFRKVGPGETERVPYLSHLLGVASVALEFGATEDEAIAALLHDALEDGPDNTGRDADDLRREILERFGPAVTAIVDDATDAAPKAGEEKAPWPERKRAYLAKLPSKPASSLLVSASDKLHNSRNILVDVLARPQSEREAYFDRFKQGQAGILQYYRRLADTYLSAGGEMLHLRPELRELFRELDRTVQALEAACGTEAEAVRQHEVLRV